MLCKQGILKGIVNIVKVENVRDPAALMEHIPVDTVTYIYHSAAKGIISEEKKYWKISRY